ncbi:structural protein P5 [Vibrio sp. YMD68]|uniref:structural protein P5 n=1 Tax=Vibrio sp. YMD68 TaxID=3042300 RepID=UPI00249B2D78|nr:structural protein P5 [Vibrio sp. YMD68]WGW00353.1 structural protein P5 [Vibrio sp. YMD68]WGW00966.1 structural protein P5 [Vibrio sp. YMD68]
MNKLQMGTLGGIALIGLQLFRHRHSGNPAKTAIEEIIGMGTPRGIRNNNPTNIKHSEHNDWIGQTGSDGTFAVFGSPEYGIRAATKLIQNYQSKYNLGTVRDIIGRWAPAGEENPHVENYIKHVSKRLGISENNHKVLTSQYPVLIAAMIEFENGVQPYDMDLIAHGVSLA